MLNIATTTLQIKTSGVNLREVETLYITIKQGDSIFSKSNSDIEVESDVVSVALTKEEEEHLKSGTGIRVTITAVDNAAVSTDVKVVWVKFGSQNASVSGEETGGKDGFSPTIKENPENTQDVYRLDITTIDGTFTTPNLKGGNGGSGSAFEVANWYEISNDGFSFDGQATWSIEYIAAKQDNYNVLSLAIGVPSETNCPFSYVFGTYGLGEIYLNGDRIAYRDNTYVSSGQSGNGVLSLKAGANNVVFRTKPGNSSYAISESITLSPLAV